MNSAVVALNAIATQQGLLYMHHLAGKDLLIKKVVIPSCKKHFHMIKRIWCLLHDAVP